MVLFLVTLLVWIVTLFFIRPHPSDLQARMPGYWESFKGIPATFSLGIFLIFSFFVFSGGTFIELNNNWFLILGVNNFATFSPWWFVQTVTKNFIHCNQIHLWMNLAFLGMLSLYERNVQAKRFLTVFFISGILSSISIFFVSGQQISAGASGGVFGLAAAYFLDIPKLTLKEYFWGCGLILLLFLMFSLFGNDKVAGVTFKVDHLGHVFGLMFGAIFCKLCPGESK